jgi:2-dehydro-3-deoxy-D-arabinonate dehydratase
MALWRVRVREGFRLAVGPVEEGPRDLLESPGLDALLAQPGGLEQALSRREGPVPEDAVLVAPIEGQEVWAAGVTYRRSRDARMYESKAPDEYDLIYEAERPELFLKAVPERVRGPGEPIGVRADSSWDVPEPELGLVVDAGGEIVAYVVGSDVSSRSIEGESPLYLPQAKIYTGSCALGPCLVPAAEAPAPAQITVSLVIRRRGRVVVEDSVSVAEMKRTPEELVQWLFRALEFPVGVILLTGTGVIPDPDFTLRPGDEVAISATGLGELRNPVELIGRA